MCAVIFLLSSQLIKNKLGVMLSLAETSDEPGTYFILFCNYYSLEFMCVFVIKTKKRILALVCVLIFYGPISFIPTVIIFT